MAIPSARPTTISARPRISGFRHGANGGGAPDAHGNTGANGGEANGQGRTVDTSWVTAPVCASGAAWPILAPRSAQVTGQGPIANGDGCIQRQQGHGYE
ncbi:MAG: hypothetical protein R2911_05645 [Caldilineaceae bacterium]